MRRFITTSVLAASIIVGTVGTAFAAGSTLGTGGSVCFANATTSDLVGRASVNQYQRVKGAPYQTVKVNVNVRSLAPSTAYTVQLMSVAQLDDNGNPSVCLVDQVGTLTTTRAGRGRLSGYVSGVQISDADGRDFQVALTAPNGTIYTSTALINLLIRN